MKKAIILLCLTIFMAAAAPYSLTLLRLPKSKITTPSPRQSTTTIAITDQPNNYIDYGLTFIRPDVQKVASRILLVPHHLMPVKQMGQAFAEAPNAKRIILISPDHFSGCRGEVCTTDAAFTYKTLTIPTVAADNKEIEHNDKLFLKEHGIRGLLPFAKTRWPEADIIPLTIKADTATSTIDALAGWINEQLQDPDTYLVATIDLSHYLPAYLADIHDRVTIRDLLSADPDRFRPMEIDNPPIARIVLTLAKNLGLKGTVTSHTNSLRLIQATTEREGTSHTIIRYGATGQDPENVTTTLYTDPTRHVFSREERYYWGFDHIVTTTTKQDWAEIQTATSTEKILLPIENLGGRLTPVTDSEHVR